MSAIASQITSLTIVCSSVYYRADQRKHQSSASLAFWGGIHQWPSTKGQQHGNFFHLMTSSCYSGMSIRHLSKKFLSNIPVLRLVTCNSIFLSENAWILYEISLMFSSWCFLPFYYAQGQWDRHLWNTVTIDMDMKRKCWHFNVIDVADGGPSSETRIMLPLLNYPVPSNQ